MYFCMYQHMISQDLHSNYITIASTILCKHTLQISLVMLVCTSTFSNGDMFKAPSQKYHPKHVKVLLEIHTFVQRAKKRDMQRWASEIDNAGLLLATFCWLSSFTTAISIGASPFPDCWSPFAPCVALILSTSIESPCPVSVCLRSTTARRLCTANSSMVWAT